MNVKKVDQKVFQIFQSLFNLMTSVSISSVNLMSTDSTWPANFRFLLSGDKIHGFKIFHGSIFLISDVFGNYSIDFKSSESSKDNQHFKPFIITESGPEDSKVRKNKGQKFT